MKTINDFQSEFEPIAKEFLRPIIKGLVEETLSAMLLRPSKNGNGHAEPAEPVESFKKVGKATKVARKKMKRDMTCIAAGCKQHSKGPRFRYLCPTHVDATAEQVAEWKEKRGKKS